MSEDGVDVPSPTQITARERFLESGKHGVETGSLEYTFLKTEMEIEEGAIAREEDPAWVDIAAFFGVGELKDQICQEYLSGALSEDDYTAAKERLLELGNQAASMYEGFGASLESEMLKNSIGTVGISNRDIVRYGDTHGLNVPSSVRAKSHGESFETTGQADRPRNRRREWITRARIMFRDLKEGKISKEDYDRIIRSANQNAPEGLTLDEAEVEGSLADRILRADEKSNRGPNASRKF